MQPIIYDVAVSIDGFISGPDGNISAFPSEGQILDDHLCRLAAYRTVIMGRGTYELGYRFGLWPGANPYPKARTIVFSRTMELLQGASVELRRDLRACDLDALKDEADGPIYLCGGGSFAAQVRNMGRLDQLRLKRANMAAGRPSLQDCRRRCGSR